MERDICTNSEVDDCDISVKLESVDRISELPDDLKSSILSLLPLKEAQATCILSSRWRYMWASRPRDILYFDADECLCQFPVLSPELIEHKTRRFVDWVDHLVEQHKGSGIEQFRVCFRLNGKSANSIDKWIQFALEKRTHVLVLTLLRLSGKEDSYSFPPKLIDLNYSSSTCNGFESLKVIELTFVNVTDEIVQHFLSKCRVLERLSICYDTSLVSLKVAGPSIVLKHLVIKKCFRLQSIEVYDAASLVSFTYHGDEVSLSLFNLPLLVEIDVSIYFNKFYHERNRNFGIDISGCLPQLESLGLVIRNSYPFDLRQFSDMFPIRSLLPNLKHLELAVSEKDVHALPKLCYFLKTATHLQRLVLHCYFSDTDPYDRSYEQAGECKHCNLKVVQVLGYRASKIIVPYVNYLIENVVSLEKIVIDPRRRGDIVMLEGKRGLKRWKWKGRHEITRCINLKDKCPRLLNVFVTMQTSSNGCLG